MGREHWSMSCGQQARSPAIPTFWWPYLVMDLIEGRRLTDLLAAEPLSAEQIATIGADVAGALSAGPVSGQ
jgi:hypothetical protein